MKAILLTIGALSLLTGSAVADTIDYNTVGSALSCNGVAGCVQNSARSVTVGGLTFTYNTGSGSGVATPSIINFGNIVTIGTSSGVSVSGLLLSINVNSTPPGGSGTLPNGTFSGSIATNNSGTTLLFSPNNTTTSYGTLPGVTISGPTNNYIYQVLNPTLGLLAPTVGNPLGQTNIQGAVTVVSTVVAATPEPSSLVLLGTGMVGFAGFARRKFAGVRGRSKQLLA